MPLPQIVVLFVATDWGLERASNGIRQRWLVSSQDQLQNCLKRKSIYFSKFLIVESISVTNSFEIDLFTCKVNIWSGLCTYLLFCFCFLWMFIMRIIRWNKKNIKLLTDSFSACFHNINTWHTFCSERFTSGNEKLHSGWCWITGRTGVVSLISFVCICKSEHEVVTLTPLSTS